MKVKNKDFLLLTLSAFILATGIYFFKFPNNFNFGGVTGIAVLVAKTGFISASDCTFILNILLLVVGFGFSGKSFGFKTVYISILNSVLLSIFQRVFPITTPLTNEPILELVFAIALPAFAAAILFNINASGGGTDIIAVLLKKYTNIDIGKALFFTDLVISISTFFIFDIKTGLFSFIGLTIKALMIDRVIEDFNLCKYFNVVCQDSESICNYIVENLHRSATVCEAKGAFTHMNKYIIFTVLSRREASLLKHYIKKVEPTAFVLISKTSEIIGKGFHSIDIE